MKAAVKLKMLCLELRDKILRLFRMEYLDIYRSVMFYKTCYIVKLLLLWNTSRLKIEEGLVLEYENDGYLMVHAASCRRIHDWSKVGAFPASE
jgi:hypothetical protein